MECIVHFEVIREGETKAFRGLIEQQEPKKPSAEQLVKMFDELGYKVEPFGGTTNFHPVAPDRDYKIHVKKLDMGEPIEDGPDRTRDNLLQNLMNLNRPY
ncbi:dipeptidyl aminopeptidase [Paenibacillus sp. KN14-4R]|uniref:dipeptidyl aminopeptidase n=1 Tax=Paenibacillus sp. KN14-4R TaxID=3445773 RepID=UPI003F9F9C7A